MIRIKNLNKTYFGASPLHVLKGINLDVERGEFLSIMGSSGSGKSTLLNILGILDTYDTGDYYLDNVLIKNLSETKAAELRNHKIGFIFQSFNLISFKNAVENVALPLYYQGVSRKKRNILAMEYLDKMGLKTHADHLPNELSGGQKQRVAIARALIAQPQIILADEPTGALDSKTSDDVMHILREVNTLDGITMIIVTHEQGVAEATDRIIHIKDGIISRNEDRKSLRTQNDQQPKIIDTELTKVELQKPIVIQQEKSEKISGIKTVENHAGSENKVVAEKDNFIKTNEVTESLHIEKVAEPKFIDVVTSEKEPSEDADIIESEDRSPIVAHQEAPEEIGEIKTIGNKTRLEDKISDNQLDKKKIIDIIEPRVSRKPVVAEKDSLIKRNEAAESVENQTGSENKVVVTHIKNENLSRKVIKPRVQIIESPYLDKNSKKMDVDTSRDRESEEREGIAVTEAEKPMTSRTSSLDKGKNRDTKRPNTGRRWDYI